jgi:hypothetical protein
MSRVSQVVLLGLSATCAGCLAEPPGAPPAVSEVASALTCSGFGCNDNSPIIAGAPFYELNIHGIPNDHGLRVTGFRSASGAPFQIDVRQARLVGLDPAGNIALDTPGISHAVIQLTDKFLNTWEIKVVEIDSVGFWAAPAGLATTYHLQVHRPPGKDFDLCSNPPDPTAWPGNVFHAILFEGDRYSPVEKTVLATGSATAGWFNIACAGTATAKLHLARHTEPSASPTLPTVLTQRQAMLRAYTAAVCPHSDAFTGKGEKLIVADNQGLMTGPPNLRNIEALWGPSGALCKTEWRLVHANSMPQADANTLLAQIPVQCPGVPLCSSIVGFPGNWQQHGMVLTTNP